MALGQQNQGPVSQVGKSQIPTGVPTTVQGGEPNGPKWKRSGNASVAMNRYRRSGYRQIFLPSPGNPFRRLANTIRGQLGADPLAALVQNAPAGETAGWWRMPSPRHGVGCCGRVPDRVWSRLPAWLRFDRRCFVGNRSLRLPTVGPDAAAFRECAGNRRVAHRRWSVVACAVDASGRAQLSTHRSFIIPKGFQPFDPGRAAHPGIGEKTKVSTPQGS